MRKPAFDPRTVAREIPGLFDAIFPQLTPGIVSAFNRDAEQFSGPTVTSEEIARSSLEPAMLFELSLALAERLVLGDGVDWSDCVRRAVERQRRYFDARSPQEVGDYERGLALRVAENLARRLLELSKSRQSNISPAPFIPGYQWIACGHGDFSVQDALVEVKCTSRNFSAADYRQLVMYWLLSYSHALEGRGQEWKDAVLVNPRAGRCVSFCFDEFVSLVSGGRTKAEILGLFGALVGTRSGT